MRRASEDRALDGGTRECGICGNQASLVWPSCPGYQEPDTFDIFWCCRCDTSFAWPMDIGGEIYEAIYKNAWMLPGYQAYRRLAWEVRGKRDPLAVISSWNCTYWGIAAVLNGWPAGPMTKVLDVGSGLGYLTYAIRRRGYDATGLDISPRAVEQAIQLYGGSFICDDLKSFSLRHRGDYQVVVMAEVSEHIPDVVDVLRAGAECLAPGGDLVVTTPDIRALPPGAIWVSDPPPVHLWSFSETSLEEIGNELCLPVRFVDLRPSGISHRSEDVHHRDYSVPTEMPRIDAEGNILLRLSAAERLKAHALNWLARMGLMSAARNLRSLVRPAPKTVGGRAHTLCAVYKKGKIC